MIHTLPAKSTPEVVERKLEQLAGDGSTYVIAVEVFDHPEAERVADGARFGGDSGPTTMGAWILGRPDEVYAKINERGYEDYEELYSAGYED